MLKIENTDVYGWEAAIRGMRNPMNSWERSDSDYRPIICSRCDSCQSFENSTWEDCDECEVAKTIESAPPGFLIGPNDHGLMMKLAKGGSVHAKYRRMITVTVDITAPLYWWKEFDTYKVGTVANSCSTMHKIHDKEFVLDDFSHEHLWGDSQARDVDDPIGVMNLVIDMLNTCRDVFLETNDKDYWWQMIQLLPSSYNQKRTIQLNYEVLVGMYRDRKNHKLDEWHTFCDWIESLPYSEIVTGVTDDIHGTDDFKV